MKFFWHRFECQASSGLTIVESSHRLPMFKSANYGNYPLTSCDSEKRVNLIKSFLCFLRHTFFCKPSRQMTQSCHSAHASRKSLNESSDYPIRSNAGKKGFGRHSTNKAGVGNAISFESSKCSRRVSIAVMLLSESVVFCLIRGQVNQIVNLHTPATPLLQIALTALLCIPPGILICAGVGVLEFLWNHHRHSLHESDVKNLSLSNRKKDV